MHQSIKIRWEKYKFLCKIFDEMPNLKITIIILKNFHVALFVRILRISFS